MAWVWSKLSRVGSESFTVARSGSVIIFKKSPKIKWRRIPLQSGAAP